VTGDDDRVKIVAIITLGAILLAAVIGLVIVAVLTDRDLFRAQTLTFAGVVLLATLGGLSWAALHRRRRRWHVDVEHNGNGDHD
jgi:protein-S-isoprenylcysteine O-methyltransferase Ste14